MNYHAVLNKSVKIDCYSDSRLRKSCPWILFKQIAIAISVISTLVLVNSFISLFKHRQLIYLVAEGYSNNIKLRCKGNKKQFQSWKKALK